MAYVFNRVKNLYDNQQGGSAGSASDTTKSEATSSAVGQNRSPEQFTRTSGNNDFGALVDRNRNVSQDAVSNTVLNPARQEAEGIKGAFQRSGQDYLTEREKELPQAPGQEDFDKFQKGDSDAGSRLQKLFSGPVGQVKAYSAPVMDDRIDAATFNQQGDLSSYLQEQRGGNYTKGMGALDDLLFRQSDAGRNVGTELQKLQSGVDEEKKRMTGAEGLTKQAQTKAEDKSKQIKNNIREEIQKRSAAIRNAPTVSKAALDRSGLEGQLNALMGELNINPADIEAARTMGLFDAGQYEVPLSQQTNSSYTPEQRAQFERLMGLIGGSDLLSADGQAVDRMGYDVPNLRSALDRARNQVKALRPETVPNPGRLTATSFNPDYQPTTVGTSQPVQQAVTSNQAMQDELARLFGGYMGNAGTNAQNSTYVGAGSYLPGFW